MDTGLLLPKTKLPRLILMRTFMISVSSTDEKQGSYCGVQTEDFSCALC